MNSQHGQYLNIFGLYWLVRSHDAKRLAFRAVLAKSEERKA